MKNNNLYLFKVPKVNIVKGRIEYILEKCSGKKVLHLGCVDECLTIERMKQGTLMHLQLLKVVNEIYGVDISEEGIKRLQNEGINNLILGDVEHLDSIKELQEKDFDIILATEIIEHLNNPGLFLQSAKALFTSKTEMILTTPSTFRFIGIRYHFKGYELVHPDHTCWFSWKTLSTLLTKNGYVINEILAYSFIDPNQSILKRVIEKILERNKGKNDREMICEDTSEKRSAGLGEGMKAIKDIFIRRYLYKHNPFFSDGLIFVVKPKET